MFVKFLDIQHTDVVLFLLSPFACVVRLLVVVGAVVAASFTNEASRAQVRAHGHRAGPVTRSLSSSSNQSEP